MTKSSVKPQKRKSGAAVRAGAKQSEFKVKGKAAASPASTGGLGTTFENRVQALKLLHMCMGIQSPGIPDGWAIVALRFQARVHGPQTDDLVCTVRNPVGDERRVLMQMKSGLTAQKSDTAFREAIRAAWLDFKNSNDFVQGQDRIIIVHDANAQHSLSGAAAVSRAAQSSLTSKEWLEKIEPAGVGNQLKRNALAAFRDIVNDVLLRRVDDGELLSFLQHLSFLSHDLLHDGTYEHVQLLNSTRVFLKTIGAVIDASYVWSKLVTTCNSLNGDGAGISIETVGNFIGDDLARAFKLIREGAAGTGVAFGVRQDDSGFSADVGMSPFIATVGRRDVREAVPAARDTSENKLISSLLDKVNVRIKAGKYKDAMTDLVNLGEDMKPLDAHQKARWYLMRGVCNWHIDEDIAAGDDFLKAASLCDDDDKLAAARARGLLLKKDLDAAIQAGEEALERFPQSLSVWLVTQNARMMKGITLAAADIPVQHREEADAYHLLAWSIHRDGDEAGAAAVAREALKLQTASYFTRDLALSYTLSSVVGNTLNVTFNMLTQEELGFIDITASAFEPLLEKLWSMQSDSTVRDTVKNLGFAYVLLNRCQDALKLLDEAKSRDICGPECIRLELECYIRLAVPDRAMAFGSPLIKSMPVDALVTFAQISSNAGDEETLEQSRLAAMNLEDVNDRTRALELIETLRWDLMMNAGRTDEVVEQLDSLNLGESTSVPLLVQASQLLRRAGQREQSSACLDRLSNILNRESSPADKYLAASALLYGQRLQATAAVYEGLLRRGIHSELHNDLLFCHLRLGAYAKAKNLIDGFPDGWDSNHEARHMAIQLGQLVGDWQLLAQLSVTQLGQAPDKAMSWIFRTMMAGRESQIELLKVLTSVPEIVVGTNRELTQLAICEMSNGFAERGLRRLYRMRRQNPTDVDVAASYLSAMVTSRTPVPHLEHSLPEIKPGCFFTLVDAEGREFTRVIDPEEITTLSAEGVFRPASDKEMSPFLGAKIGTQIEISHHWGAPLQFTVISIGSAYRYLLDDSQKVLRESLGKSTFLTILDIPEDDDGTLDISKLEDQVLRSAESGRGIMEAYRIAPLTIGGICGLLNRGVFDAICGWPAREVELEVGGGPYAERTAAIELLKEPDALFVIDAATIVELARVGCLSLLSKIRKPLCSTKTYELIRGELEESANLPSRGTAVEHEGSMALVEISEQNWTNRLEMLREIAKAIETYCDIRPSYGPENFNEVPLQLREVISSEEAAVLMLAAEYRAAIFCMDARLRMLASTYCNLKGIWPQTFLSWCLSNGHITQRDYSVACVKFFLSGRNFTSLTDLDLLYAMYQGGAWPGLVISAFKEHVSKSSVDFHSAHNVSAKFLAGLAGSGRCQVGFLIQSASIIVEGLARHKDCPSDFGATLFNELRHAYGIRSLRDETLDYLKLSIDGGVERSKFEKPSPVFKGKVLFCASPPWLMSGLTVGDTVELIRLDESEQTNQADNSPTSETSGPSIAEID